MQHTQNKTTTPAITAAISPVETPEEDDGSEVDGESGPEAIPGGGCESEPFIAGNDAPGDDGGDANGGGSKVL